MAWSSSTGNRRITHDSTRSLRPPIAAAALIAALLVAATSVRNRSAVAVDAPLDHLVQLLPGLLILVVLVLALLAGSRMRLGLTAFAVAVIVRFAGPALIDAIPSIGLPGVVWTSDQQVGDTWINEIFAGTNTVVRIGDIAVLAATALLVLCVVWLGLVLSPVLTAPALRSSFGIDTTLLITVLALAGALSWVTAYGVGLDPSELVDAFGSGNVWALTRTIVWVLPVVVWLAFTCRRGGALAVGSTAGVFTAVAVLPWAMDRLAVIFNGPRSIFSFAGQSDGYSFLSGYEAYDPFGTSVLVVIPSAVLLLIVLWWALSHQASVDRAQSAAPAGAPVSGLAVVAFVLAWIPITCLPAIVLGHMAYDSVATSEVPQRGIGLARWSIVLAYLTLAGTCYLVVQTWVR